MRELVRRLALAAFVLSATALALHTPRWLMSVRPVDWSAERRTKINQGAAALATISRLVGRDQSKDLSLTAETDGNIDAFIASETKERLITVTTGRWRTLHDGIDATLRGVPPDKGWKSRIERDFLHRSLYFRPDESPLDEIYPSFSDTYRFSYVRIDGHSIPLYLAVTLRDPADSTHWAPVQLAYPYLHFAPWLLLMALLVYGLMPWPAIPERGVYYSRLVGGVLPDLVAIMLMTPFFAIPFVVTSANAGGAGLFGNGWGFLTLICWGLSLMSASMLPFAAWYTWYRLDVLPDGLCERTLRRRREITFSEIKEVTVSAHTAPAWLKGMLWLAGLRNMGVAGQAMLLGSRSDTAFDIVLKDGGVIRLFEKGLKGHFGLIDSLRTAGVPVHPDVYMALDKDAGNKAFDRNAVNIVAKSRLPISISILVAIGLIYAIFMTRTVRPPALEDAIVEEAARKADGLVKPIERVPSFEQVREQNEILSEMKRQKNMMDEAARRIQFGSGTEKLQGRKDWEAAQSEFIRLQERFENVQSGKTQK